jgi:hypothetical protein
MPHVRIDTRKPLLFFERMLEMNVCTYKIECRRICSVRVLKEESRYASVRNILQNGLLRGGMGERHQAEDPRGES